MSKLARRCTHLLLLVLIASGQAQAQPATPAPQAATPSPQANTPPLAPAPDNAPPTKEGAKDTVKEAPAGPVKEPPKASTGGTKEAFFLQAGSFRTQADADRVRAQIIMLGQDVRVESGKVKDDTWYRVLVGPYSDRDQLTQAQKQLAGSGFKNLLLQQRRGH